MRTSRSGSVSSIGSQHSMEGVHADTDPIESSGNEENTGCCSGIGSRLASFWGRVRRGFTSGAARVAASIRTGVYHVASLCMYRVRRAGGGEGEPIVGVPMSPGKKHPNPQGTPPPQDRRGYYMGMNHPAPPEEGGNNAPHMVIYDGSDDDD